MSNSNWLLVSDGTPQMMYAGKSDLLDDQIEEIAQKGGFLTLEEGRTLRSILIPNAEGGIILQNQLVPAAICRTATPIRVKPSAYIRPDAITLTVLRKQVEECEKAELKHRLKAAGLSSVGDITPDGLRR